MKTVIELVTDKLFQEVKEEYEKHGELSDNILSSLNFVFGQPLLSALDLVDRDCVSHVTTPCQKEVYQVSSDSGRTYTCPATLQYCPCLSYAFGVVKRGELLVCKHILAIQLSRATGSCKEVQADDEKVSVILFEQDY
ncbi:unnamed protein product [Clavelina lepadiformis]|uniref:SWIM-type domain-containing protein n=1 Tax=Clavelina lepadiformis TaxID=159417 RepID=A0ABP0GQ39_CLALP